MSLLKERPHAYENKFKKKRMRDDIGGDHKRCIQIQREKKARKLCNSNEITPITYHRSRKAANNPSDS